jgi:3-oxoacyl-[acyl-carrier-protein] synthase III
VRSTASDLLPRSSNGAPRPSLRGVGVAGVGSYVPERVLTNADLEKIVETSDEWITTRTGIAERRIAAQDESTSLLAIAAARGALEDAGLTGDQIDMVIVATVTPDNLFPSVSSLVQDALGAEQAGAFDLAAGCSGFVYGLVTGAQFVATGAANHVLVIGAETLSRLVDWSDRATCVLFGDGAGAVVLGPCADDYGILSFDTGSDGSGASLLYVDPIPLPVPLDQNPAPVPRSCMRMNGAEVFKFAVRVIEDSTRRSLAKAGLDVADIDCFVAHQANARIFDAAAKRLGIPTERVFNNVHRYGNTSSASIPIALAEARADGQINNGDIVALVGFGAGLAWASAIVRWGCGGEDAR